MEQIADFTSFSKFFIGLFALVNPVGILPVYISLTAGQPRHVANLINLKANLSVAIILWTSLFFGDGVLRVFGISIDSFRVAGGILLCSVAMTMVNGRLNEGRSSRQEDGSSDSSGLATSNIGIVPLALPLMAGPGAIGATVVWGARHQNWPSLLGLSLTAGLFALCCWALYQSAPLLIRALGQTGINVITRIMGILLMALGIEFILTGVQSFFSLSP